MTNIDQKRDDIKAMNEAGDETGDTQSADTIAREMSEEERLKIGMSALAFFRTWAAARGVGDEIEASLTTLERRILRPREASEQAALEGPSTERTTPPTSSRFAIRDDGALLLSLEDADERDVTGRTVIPFLLLTGDDDARARRVMDLALSDVAAKVIGALPMKAPKL